MPRGRQRLGDGEEEGEVLVLNAAKHLQRASAIKAFGSVWQHQRIAVAAAATAASADCAASSVFCLVVSAHLFDLLKQRAVATCSDVCVAVAG